MALIGAILGDICGSVWEFDSNPERDVYSCPLFTEDSHFTDDTVLTLATKDALQGDGNFANAYDKWASKYPAVGYGGRFRKWMSRLDKKPYNSMGNGSAMRVSYIVDHAKTMQEARDLAVASASVTHNHPEGVKGASVTVACAYLAKMNVTRSRILEYACEAYPATQYKYSCELSLEELREIYKWSALCQDSVPVAVRCVYESTSYESFLRNVLSLPCDTDTICAIGGCIAEEYYATTGLDNYALLKKYLTPELYNLVIC